MDDWTQEDAFELAERESRSYQKQIAELRVEIAAKNSLLIQVAEWRNEVDSSLVEEILISKGVSNAMFRNALRILGNILEGDE